ncbi:MAG: hypothetical protein AAF490_24920, partial [Chloroflexota bacterium]
MKTKNSTFLSQNAFWLSLARHDRKGRREARDPRPAVPGARGRARARARRAGARGAPRLAPAGAGAAGACEPPRGA